MVEKLYREILPAVECFKNALDLRRKKCYNELKQRFNSEVTVLKELNDIIAANIAELRKASGMTQNDLAEKLNYSDKAVSKWERGESIPDVSVLKAISDCFGVTVDYLLTREHKLYQEEKRENKKRKKGNRIIITLIAAVVVWLVAIFLFMNLDSFLRDTKGIWLVFIYAVPITGIVALVFNMLWGKRLFNFIIASVILWTLITGIYLSFLVLGSSNVWLLFVLGVPGQVIILLSSRLRLK